jgi:hypothetical protein
MVKPFLALPGYRAEGLVAMVAKMNRIENAARLAMADPGPENATPAAQSGIAFAVKLGLVLASLTMTGLIAATFI